MALVEKKVSNFASYRGAPSSNTLWDKVSWDFDAKHVKVVVTPASTVNPEMSLDGNNVHCSLEMPVATQNAMVYTFENLGVSRLYFRKTAATIEVYAYGVH